MIGFGISMTRAVVPSFAKRASEELLVDEKKPSIGFVIQFVPCVVPSEITAH